MKKHFYRKNKLLLSFIIFIIILLMIPNNSAINESYLFSLQLSTNSNFSNIPKLAWHPKYYDFGYVQKDNLYHTNFEIWNNGTDVMYWNLQVRDSWVEVFPSSGFSFGEHDRINVTINTSNLYPGNYEGNVYIHSEGDYIFYTYFSVSEAKLAFYPKFIEIDNIEKNNSYQIDFEIWNEGIGKINWSIQSNNSFIQIIPLNGSSSSEYDTINIVIDTINLSLGKYVEIINIYSDGGNDILRLNFTINNPPSTPLINGKTKIRCGEESTYEIISYDPDEDKISYYIDWGDGLNDSWSSFIPSGVKYNISKIWNEDGIYSIKVKAKDLNNFESEWSIIEVEIPIVFIKNFLFKNIFKIFFI